MMAKQNRLLCIGEVLWDALPSGLFLGGAPLNVCYHLNRLGIDAAIAGRVGDDRLGKEALRRINKLGISTELMQIDDEFETGFVEVELTSSGDPDYRIAEPVAWDRITASASLEQVIEDCWGLVFGSLAQRHAQSRSTIQQLWKHDVKLIFDLNLREPFVDRQVVYQSLEQADIVKMNEEELSLLIDWLSLPVHPKKAVDELGNKFGGATVCVTRGAKGAMLFLNGQWYQHNGFPVEARDSVGAGDALLAVMLFGIINDKPGQQIVKLANAAGSLVARKDGATPYYTLSDLFQLVG